MPLSPPSLWSGFVPRGSASCKGTLGTVGTCHQGSTETWGTGKGPHSLLVCMGTMLRLIFPEITWVQLSPYGRCHHPPLGTAAPPGDTEHPRRAWLFAPAGTGVAPGYTQLFGGSPSLWVSPNPANPPGAGGALGLPGGCLACRGGWRWVPATDAADSGPSQMVPIFMPGPGIFSPWIKADGRSWVMPRKHPLGGCRWCEV